MANNRLYIVDTFSNEYLCIAKGWGSGWFNINTEDYSAFMKDRFNDSGDKTILIIGTENDDDFYYEWLEKGIDYKNDNKINL